MNNGVIYILINPSFPGLVKIGYADNMSSRLKQLNNSECLPYAFRVYATYEVSSRLSDKKVHSIIDRLNPTLRSVDNLNGQRRVREFYEMKPEEAYSILEAIAEINGCEDKLKLYKPDDAIPEQKANVSKPDKPDILDSTHTRSEPFRFSMCGIKSGETIDFWRTANQPTGISCKVVDDKHVEYDGKIYSLTALAKLLVPTNNPIRGTAYFKYKGRWLNDLRSENDN